MQSLEADMAKQKTDIDRHNMIEEALIRSGMIRPITATAVETHIQRLTTRPEPVAPITVAMVRPPEPTVQELLWKLEEKDRLIETLRAQLTRPVAKQAKALQVAESSAADHVVTIEKYRFFAATLCTEYNVLAAKSGVMTRYSPDDVDMFNRASMVRSEERKRGRSGTPVPS